MLNHASMKTCKKCLESKSFESFYKHSGMRDGFLSICKECTIQRIKRYRKNNIETIREYDRERGKTEARRKQAKKYQQKHREEIQKYKIEWRKNHPKLAKAHNAVARAIAKKQLIQQPCSVCGILQSEAHHPDYDAPLEVVWLCRKHHSELHNQIRKNKRKEIPCH